MKHQVFTLECLCSCQSKAVQGQALLHPGLVAKAEQLIVTNQAEGFQRLIPGSAKYLRYLPRIRPADRLLAAWDSRYGPKGLEGRELLTQLCEKGVHLEGSGSNENIKARVTRVPKHIITC